MKEAHERWRRTNKNRFLNDKKMSAQIINKCIHVCVAQVFFAVVLFGLFHGLCYLPVLLSAIGPAPYESARDHKSEKQHGSGRSSPVHPVRAEDNKGLEIESKNNTNENQPNGYYIPAPDYHGKTYNNG